MKIGQPSLGAFLFGRAPRPVTCGNGLVIGAGTVIPEINFTLPPMQVRQETLPEVREQYRRMITGVCDRAVELEVPGLLVEFETLPDMTVNPEWGLEITRLLADALGNYRDRHGLVCALRLTPNDTREQERPPRMRGGRYLEGMQRFFEGAAGAGADLIGIESTGGKEVCDEALINCDLPGMVYALGSLGARDMEFLWKRIVKACDAGGIVPSGDTACGFANTAMVLADRKMIPRVFAAVVRVASVPRTLVAYEVGARGPGKDCGYENPYMKALAGVPISMEGRSAACAHLSPVGNIASAVCDCWSNESVQNVRLLSGDAPVVSLEHLAYDCRLMNEAGRSPEDAVRLRDWMVASDAGRDPQAWVLAPEVVLRLSGEIAKETTPYARTRRAVQATIAELRRAHASGELHLAEREAGWLGMMLDQAGELPEREEDLIARMSGTGRHLPEEYGLGGAS